MQRPELLDIHYRSTFSINSDASSFRVFYAISRQVMGRGNAVLLNPTSVLFSNVLIKIVEAQPGLVISLLGKTVGNISYFPSFKVG